MAVLRTLSLAAALVAAPALAAPAPPDLAAWLAANTDLPAAQIAIAGPTHVYSLEPLGARTPAGEVIALVRTEPLAGDWGAAHGFQSWDAHLLFDCAGRRLRQIRGATYPERNRRGPPKPEPVPEGWTSPQPDEPAAQLLAAACDPAFAWALRRPDARLATQPLPPPPVLAADAFAVQLARGPSQDGAKRALKAARKTLGPLAHDLADTTETTSVAGQPRYTARLAGFPDAAAAQAACHTLIKAGQACFTWQERADPQTAALEPAAAATATTAGYVVQLARGPSEDGAQRALKAARKALQTTTAPRRLTATTQTSQVAGETRYTALLGGFQTAGEAARACAALLKAGQTCFARPADDGAD